MARCMRKCYNARSRERVEKLLDWILRLDAYTFKVTIGFRPLEVDHAG